MKRVGSMIKVFWGIGLLALLGGCASSIQPDSGEEGCQVDLYATTWRLETIDGMPAELKRPATIRFEKSGKFTGFSGCNRYFGRVMITPTTMGFGPIGATRRFCQGQRGVVERKLFAVLKGTRWWQLTDRGELRIFDDEHRAIFVPER